MPAVTDDPLTSLVRTAHGDAWEVEGRLRERFGGGAARVRGARLMASGIAQPKWNNADVTSSHVDIDAMSAWYRARRVPWGVRVPLEFTVELGTPLFVKRCVGLRADAFQARETDVRVVHETDVDAFATLDSTIFGSELAEARAWLAPQFEEDGFRHWVAKLGDSAAAIATTVQSRGDAGPAAYVCGVKARPGSPRNALDAVVAVAVHEAFDAGAELVHANPDDDEMLQAFTSLGATEVPGFHVRVVVAE